MADVSRAEHLRAMISGAEERMLSETCSDQNYAVLGRMRAEFLVQIEAIEAAGRKGDKSGGSGSATVDEFTKRRRSRGA